MEVNFYLRSEFVGKKGFAPIRMQISVNGETIKKNLKKVKIKPKYWENDKQKIKKNTKNEDYNYYDEYNQIIEDQRAKVIAIERHALNNKIPLTKQYVLSKLEEKISLSVERDFFETFQLYIDNSEFVKAESTIKGYKSIKKFIEDFHNEAGYPVLLDRIDLDFFHNLRRYAFEKRETYNNYFAKIINVLKGFMTWALKQKYHQTLDYKDFRASEDDVEVIYLTLEELLTLLNKPQETKTYERVKDSYCFACFTGLRISDLSKLTPSQIFDEYIKINVFKTRNSDHLIPLNKYSKSILEKYKGTVYEPIPIISEQKFNEYLKKCCEKAEINKVTTITRYIGSERIEITGAKFEFITTHTARKTFCTNSLILGMQERTVRTITGHKTERSFRKYVKIADNQTKKQMEDTWDRL
jgi:integrase